MTTHDDRVQAVRELIGKAGETHRITLTGEDAIGALCNEACRRLGIVGGFTGMYEFRYTPDGALDAVDVTLTPSPTFLPESAASVVASDPCACCGVRPADTEVSNAAASPGRRWEWLDGVRLSAVCWKEYGDEELAARVRARLAVSGLETNAQRIVRETPQSCRDIGAKAVTEATARRKLGELNEAVTAAILRAEQHPPGAEASRAWHVVSQIEEKIASVTTPHSIEGAVARRGAITAALGAGDWLRALTLGEAYLAELGLPSLTQQQMHLRTLRTEALAAAKVAASEQIPMPATDFPKSDT